MTLSPEQAEWIEQQMRLLEERIQKETGRDVIVSVNRATMSYELLAEEVLRLVSDVTKTPAILILSASRKTDVSFARYICWYVLKHYYGKENTDRIGKLFNRDRSTVCHGLATAADLLKTENAAFVEMYNAVMSNIKLKKDETNED